MRLIYKYSITGFRNVIGLPVGWKVLTVQMQRGVPQMWAAVDPQAKIEQVTFLAIGTGAVVPDNAEYVGTFQDAQFVWHLHYLKE